ncbi:unnamed protein product [Gordionus sp. m RMFG-2023]|uniref:mitochondrial import inner membrane translocase subunit TIM16-like n=1 Tax=Gordionus sp. m RMFG-2023 TaxID=3053472 RepID=UPI0030E07FD2
MAKYLAQIIVLGTRIISQAFIRALQQEYQAAKVISQKQGPSSANSKQTSATNLRTGITIEEAIQILNISPDLKPEDVQEKYKHLFDSNDKSKGGSFYIQSKIVRAKERIDAEINFQKNAERLKSQSSSSSKTS